MNDETFHFSDHEDDFPLDTSMICDLNASVEDTKNDGELIQNVSAMSDDLDDNNEGKDFVQCEQQDQFPFIEGTQPTDEVRAMLRKCRAYAHFYEMPSVMRGVESCEDGAGVSTAWAPCWRPVLRTVAVAGLSTLLVGEGDAWATVNVGTALNGDGRPQSPVKQVLVHHEMQPTIRRYIVLLQEDSSLTVLSFPNFEVVTRYSSVARVRSVDDNRNGRPSLEIFKRSGERVRWSPLYSDAADDSSSRTPPPPAKLQVAQILQSKLHAAADRLQRLESSCRQQEVFISTHIDRLRAVLAGGGTACRGAATSKLSPGQTSLPSVTADDASLCRVTAVRCKVVNHASLLICAAVSNCSSRLLLTNLELVLSLHPQDPGDSTSMEHLEYKSYVYRSVMRVSKQKFTADNVNKIKQGAVETTRATQDDDFPEFNSRLEKDKNGPNIRVGAEAGASKTSAQIELLSPCLLRPNKQAYVIGVCRMPEFRSGRYLNITGLIRFKTKPLSLQDKTPHGSSSPFHPDDVTKASGTTRRKAPAQNISSSPPEKSGVSGEKRKEFLSPELVSNKKPEPQKAKSESKSVSAVEEFLCRNGGAFVKSHYPKYEDNSSECFYQVPIRTISLDALKLDSIKMSLTQPPPKSGVSLDSLALLTSGERRSVLLRSAACGLAVHGLLARLAKLCDVRQVADVCNVYVLCAVEPSASLHHCALGLTQDEGSCMAADLYFRDSRQGLLLIHTLKAALPFDAVISPTDAASRAKLSSVQDSRTKKLYKKICETAQFLSTGIRDKFQVSRDKEQAKKKPKLVGDPRAEVASVAELYEEKRKLFLDSGAGFAVDEVIYEKWKTQLKALVAELDEAYLTAHESEW